MQRASRSGKNRLCELAAPVGSTAKAVSWDGVLLPWRFKTEQKPLTLTELVAT